MQVSQEAAQEQVLRELARIIDPDFGQDIVTCGFVKDLEADGRSGRVSFALELTTPACPIKDEFERKARDYVAALAWVSQVRARHAYPDLAHHAATVAVVADVAAACGGQRLLVGIGCPLQGVTLIDARPARES